MSSQIGMSKSLTKEAEKHSHVQNNYLRIFYFVLHKCARYYYYYN